MALTQVQMPVWTFPCLLYPCNIQLCQAQHESPYHSLHWRCSLATFLGAQGKAVSGSKVSLHAHRSGSQSLGDRMSTSRQGRWHLHSWLECLPDQISQQLRVSHQSSSDRLLARLGLQGIAKDTALRCDQARWCHGRSKQHERHYLNTSEPSCAQCLMMHLSVRQPCEGRIHWQSSWVQCLRRHFSTLHLSRSQVMPSFTRMGRSAYHGCYFSFAFEEILSRAKDRWLGTLAKPLLLKSLFY